MLYKEFIEKFSFNGDEDYNYVLRGGEIFNYIGMTVNMITYVRKPNGEIKTEENPVIIEDISDLDETLTYKIKVMIADIDSKIIETRIIPEGMSKDLGGCSDVMYRFMPFSMSLKLKEDTAVYNRFLRIYYNKENVTMNFEALKNIAKAENKRVGLYVKNLTALAEVEGENDSDESKFMYTRVCGINSREDGSIDVYLSSADNSYNCIVIKESDLDPSKEFFNVNLDVDKDRTSVKKVKIKFIDTTTPEIIKQK